MHNLYTATRTTWGRLRFRRQAHHATNVTSIGMVTSPKDVDPDTFVDLAKDVASAHRDLDDAQRIALKARAYVEDAQQNLTDRKHDLERAEHDVRVAEARLQEATEKRRAAAGLTR